MKIAKIPDGRRLVIGARVHTTPIDDLTYAEEIIIDTIPPTNIGAPWLTSATVEDHFPHLGKHTTACSEEWDYNMQGWSYTSNSGDERIINAVIHPTFIHNETLIQGEFRGRYDGTHSMTINGCPTFGVSCADYGGFDTALLCIKGNEKHYYYIILRFEEATKTITATDGIKSPIVDIYGVNSSQPHDGLIFIRRPEEEPNGETPHVVLNVAGIIGDQQEQEKQENSTKAKTQTTFPYTSEGPEQPQDSQKGKTLTTIIHPPIQMMKKWGVDDQHVKWYINNTSNVCALGGAKSLVTIEYDRMVTNQIRSFIGGLLTRDVANEVTKMIERTFAQPPIFGPSTADT